MVKVLFVCHGNICRSPMAESVFTHLINQKRTKNDYDVKSFATSREEIGNDIHPGTKDVLKTHHIPIVPHRAQQLTREDANTADLLLIMDQNNARNIAAIVGEENAHKVRLLKDYAGGGDIADPWYTGDFNKTYNDIVKSCEALLQALES